MSRQQRFVASIVLIVCAVFSTARAQTGSGPDGAKPDEIQDGEGNFLVIPGIGKIPLPPGARAFGPGNSEQELRPQTLGPQTFGPEQARPIPEPPKTPEQKFAEEMERLYARLASAEDEREAETVSSVILRRWRVSGSDTVDLLTARAAAAEVAGAPQVARSLLDYVVALAPNWSEGYVRRARLRATSEDVAGALSDLDMAARLEPKRFDALAAMGALAEKFGDRKKALDAYRKSLTISPRQDGLRKEEERLKVEIEGRDI